jgi:hypothetical protein
MSCRHLSRPMVNTTLRVTSKSCGVQAEALVPLEGKSYGGLVRHPRPFAIEQLDHIVKATLALGCSGWGRDNAPGSFTEGPVELFCIGAPTLRRTRQSAFSGGTKMSRHSTLVGVPHLVVSTRVLLGRPSMGGVASITSPTPAPGTFTTIAPLFYAHKESLVLHDVVWSSFDL